MTTTTTYIYGAVALALSGCVAVPLKGGGYAYDPTPGIVALGTAAAVYGAINYVPPYYAPSYHQYYDPYPYFGGHHYDTHHYYGGHH